MSHRSLIRAGLLGLGLTIALGAAYAADTSAPGPSSSTAQPGARGGRRGPNMARLLNLTPDQQSKWQSVQQDFRTQMQALRTANVTDSERAAKLKALQDARQKQLEAILTPTQKAQYEKALAARQGGFGMNPNAMLARMKTELNLSSDQESKIRTILSAAQTKQEALRASATKPGANATDIRQQMMSLRRDTQKQIGDVLTTDQQAKWRAAMQSMRRNRPGRGRPGTGGSPQ